MTTTLPIPFRIHPLPAEMLERVRATETDVFGNRAERFTSEGGESLRCCLRDADPGEELLLFGYQPPLPVSPYREVGAVIAHAEPCAGPAAIDDYPRNWRGRRQVLRAYDARGRIHDATTVHDGQDPETTIADMLAQPDVAQIHSRNVAWGCFMFAITRAE